MVAERWWEVSLVDDDEEAVGRGWDAWYVVGLTTTMLRPGHKKTSGVAPEGKIRVKLRFNTLAAR